MGTVDLPMVCAIWKGGMSQCERDAMSKSEETTEARRGVVLVVLRAAILTQSESARSDHPDGRYAGNTSCVKYRADKRPKRDPPGVQISSPGGIRARHAKYF